MGVDGGMSGSVSRGSVISSSDVPPLPQYLTLEPISLGSQKYTRSGELRRVLGFPLGSASEDFPHRVSSFKPSPPVATEELKQFKENVLDATIKARERLKMLRESICKLDKYREAVGSKKRQRSDLLSNEKSGGSSLLKMVGHPPRNLLDQSSRRLEDKAKCGAINKRFRSSSAELRADGKSGSLPKDQMSNEKDTNISKPVTGASVQPEERMRRLSAVGEGWERKMKRKRSVGNVANRSTDSDIKRTMHSKLSTDSKLACCDASALRSNANQDISSDSPSTVIKGKISRAPRTGSIMAVNSPPDVQASSEACEGWEQPSSMNKVVSLGLMQKQSHPRGPNSSHALGQWVGQRQQKSSRIRRVHVVSPVSNLEEGQIASLSFTSLGIGAQNSSNWNSGCFDAIDAHNSYPSPKSKIRVDNTRSPVRLSEAEEPRGLEYKVEEKGADCTDVALNGKGKVRAFVFPSKKNKNVVNENVVDGVRRQGRTVRGLSLSRPGASQCVVNSENVSMIKTIHNVRPGSDKIRSKSGRPPSKKMSDGRAFTRSPESDDDHEELLAAAASARKASHLSCSGRFWRKREPIFGSVGPDDVSYLKQQLSFVELENSLPQMPDAEYNILGVLMHKERADVYSAREGRFSNQAVDRDEALSEGLAGAKRLDKYSSLYQRVLSALIEEDECEGIYNVNEGVSVSFQCASDDSHCGSCNYTDAETRDRDRLDSEAESIVDFQIQKRCSGDGFSCNKSVTSNTTRNASMSDSLYSSGRWLGDDGLSHSDVEFVSGSCQNDQGGPQPIDVPGAFPDCQYQLMCLKDRLIMELQNVGLFLDIVPDLTGGEEVIEQDITELKDGLYKQIGKKNNNLVKIDKAIQDDREREKSFIEQVAMEQLIQMAYKRRMACRRNNASKTVMRKVSKQVAMGFIERTLARCRSFEVTGRSCFSEPALQKVLFAAPEGNQAGVNTATDTNTSCGDPKHQTNTAKADSISHSQLDSCLDDFEKGYIGSPQPASHSSEHCFPRLEPVLHKAKKKEVLLDDVGGGSSRGGFGNSIGGAAKGKRSERDRDHGRGSLMSNSARSDQNRKAKPKQNPIAAERPLSSSMQQQSSGGVRRGREMGLSSSGDAPPEACEEEEDPIDFSSLPMPDFESMEQLGIMDDPNAPQDMNFWLNFDEDGLQDHDSAGLPTPQDDLNMVL